MKVTREDKQPLINPKFNGHCHMRCLTRTLIPEKAPNDPPVKFEMILTGTDDAKLRSTNYGDNTETPMKRMK